MTHTQCFDTAGWTKGKASSLWNFLENHWQIIYNQSRRH